MLKLEFLVAGMQALQVKHRRSWRRAGSGAAILLVSAALADADAKPIRLRHAVLPAAAAAKAGTAPAAPAAETPVSGLYLIQFRSAFDARWRSQLSARGVDLLHYVPDDAFVARFREVSPGQVRALPFVEWLGKYDARYKFHRALQSGAAGPAGRLLNVCVLLAPGAAAPQLAAARLAFASVRQQSATRFGTVLRGRIDAAQLDVLGRSEAVLWIEPAPEMKLFDEVSSQIVAGEGGPNQLYTQSLGYDGSGVAVAVADSGLNNGDAATMHPDLFGRTPAFFVYGNLTDAADEHSHGTHVAGIIAGDGATGELDENGFLYGLGVAPGASIITQRIFDGVGNYEAPPSFETLTRQATRAGAVIGSNSWGDDTQGAYNISAMEFDALVRDADALAYGDQPYILEFSAGNAGPAYQTIGSPAVAKNVIATGACENNRADLFIYTDGQEAMADFSSRGPCEDGRIKPDVTAPGTWIASLQSASAGNENAWAPIDTYYLYMGGTSQAGPHVSGAAAVFVQYYRATITNATPSPALVKAALINSAVDMDDSYGTEPVPNMDEGWGRIDLAELIGTARGYDFVDQTTALETGQVFERRVIVAGSDEALKVTLAYTDVPGFPGAIPALVNDLDLEVVAPDGTLYRGNQFDAGESVPDPPNADRINNVEGVRLAQPMPGEYIIRVRAYLVPEDARTDTGAVDQDFALVTSGNLALPGMGVVALDRKAYRAPDQILIRITDTDQAGVGSVNATLRSSTETSGENVVLAAAGSSGVFTGSVATVTGTPAADGILQVSHGDTIEASYLDVSAGTIRTATATADLVAPVLTAVSVASSFGESIVSWLSDEPATSVIRYGTNATLTGLSLSVTNSALTTSHSLALPNLAPGVTYYFYVISSDAAGNTATNSNGGALYSLVAAAPPPILLLDDYVDLYGFGAPPLSAYTDPLDQLGVSYDVWDGSTLGEPTLEILQSYRAVLWRVGDFADPGTAAERLAISNYVYSGGSLFLASMEILSRLDEAGAASFTRNLLHVQSYLTDETGSTFAGEIMGTPNEPVGRDLDILMDYSVYSALWLGYIGPDISDTITPDANASIVLRNDAGDTVGLRWPAIGRQAPGRVVFFSFPFDAVPMESGVNDRIQLLRNILAFLAPGASGLSTVALDSSSYAPPAVVTLEVGDSDLAGQGTLNVSAFTTTDAGGMAVALAETATPGVFGGSFELISATNPPVTGKLRAQNGDTLTVEYFDASAGKVIRANAAVDTVSPVISGVAAEPDYEEATVFWDTSEPADTLVQFGESPILNRTAYDSALTTGHALTLPALTPNRTYYYRVVSRDAAGNPSEDDGQLYSFQTLTPLSPPWADDMDSGGTNWSVFNADDNQSQWTLGVPNNGLESSAHSAPDAWGSNLNGDWIDYSESFLISPAIDLSGGNVATLRFWHSYDFTESSEFDILEYGELLLLTNNAVAAVVLADYLDVSGGWQEETIDLTPYVGHVVYLVWDYELFSFDTRVRPGWLLDDVSIAISNVQPGSIQITNNLWQASYILTGPLYRKGKGVGTLITNAPPGQYILSFADVPYYQTPVPQTNNLVSGGFVLFQGNYTFADANANGVPDSWELAQFGVLDSNRTWFTDTDRDGMSDGAEFVAGTNPNNPLPPFRLTVLPVTNSLFTIQWSSPSGFLYRVEATTNGGTWEPCSTWLAPDSLTSSSTFGIFTSGPVRLFRVAALPATTVGSPAPNLRLAVELANSLTHLTWPGSAGRGYRILGSANLRDWTPASDWIQAASARPMEFTLPGPTNGAPSYFRVQVHP